MQELILSGYTPYPSQPRDSRLPHIAEKLTAQIHKTALGAETMVPFRYYETSKSYLAELDHPLIALEQTKNSTNVRHYSPPDTFTLLLGEEVAGIDEALLKRCDQVVEIPMAGRKESFNVSVAAGIALYAFSQ